MYVDRELVRRVEQWGAEYCSLIAGVLARQTPDTGAVAQECDGGALIAFGPGRFVNRAMGIGFGDLAADELARRMTTFYRTQKLPPSVELTPWANDELVSTLGNAGYRLERFRNVYARALDSLPAIPAVEIEPVNAETDAGRRAILANDAPIGSAARRISDEYCDAAAAIQGAHDYVALIAGEPAACGSLNILHGIAGIGGAATMPKYRGRGLQQALIAHRLAVARAAGCSLVASTAIPDGQSARNLERLGFQLLYTQTVLTAPA